MNPRRTTRPLLVLLTAATTALTLAACGGGGSSDAATPTPQSTATQGTEQQPRDAQGQGPGGGVSGQVVHVGDQLMQVRDDDGQTAVTWTDDTTVQVTTTADLSAVTVGSCVTATSGGGRVPSDDDEVATPSTDEDPVATTVTVSQPVDGAFGPGGGVPTDLPTDMPRLEGDAPGDRPTDLPTDLPGGAPDEGGGASGGMPGGAFGGVTSGAVTAVDGSTITVETIAQDGTTSSATVTVDDSTTFTTTTAGDASALVVGQCATVRGTADDSGKVAATSVVVSSPGDDGCTRGIGGRGPGGARPGQDDRPGGQTGEQTGEQQDEQGSDD